MNPNRPLHTKHRLQRYILWTLAMLQWIAAVLSGRDVSGRRLAQRGGVSLAWVTRRVTYLLLIRAGRIGRFQRRGRIHYWRHGRDLRRRHYLRSLLGAKLRRALKHKDFAKHVANLIDVLRNLDKYAAQLAHNLRRRHRLWRIAPPLAPAAALCGALACAPVFADSS
jgi:hypothetical protein